VPTPLLEEVPEPAGRIRPWVIPQDADEVPGIASVRGQCALDDAPFNVHPSKESLDPSNRLGSSLDRDDSPLAEVLKEPANTREDLSAAMA
jgi:hypothetical protein